MYIIYNIFLYIHEREIIGVVYVLRQQMHIYMYIYIYIYI